MNTLSTPGKHVAAALALVAGTCVADQLSKWYVSERLLTDGNRPFGAWIANARAVDFSAAATSVTLAPMLDFTLVWNKGVSFGLGAGHVGPWLFVAFSMLAGFLLFVWATRAQSRGLSTALALIAGGAFSNAYDRLRFGAVVDFIDAHVGSWHWPAFNVADSCIVLGAAFIMIDTLISDRKASHETAK